MFTYKDYVLYQNFISKNKSLLKEEKATYTTGKELNKKINNEHDKVFRKILEVKSEVTHFINETLNLKNKIKEEQLEKYNSSFITSNLRNQESDIIYKLKDKNIFFLIEHQTKIDYTMSLRILEYEVAIIKSAIDYDKLGQKGYKIPKVISIVLYTGKGKWNSKTYINEIQEQLEENEELQFARYNVIDINNFSEEKLLKKNTYLSKIMLLEKYNGKELTQCLNKIVKEIECNKKYYSNQGKEVLIIMIEQVLIRKIGQERAREIINKLKGVSEEMLNVIKSVDRENKAIFNNGIKSGIEKGKIEIIKEMLKLKIPISQISQITHWTEEKIKEIENTKIS